jgi:hypothetical protein
MHYFRGTENTTIFKMRSSRQIAESPMRLGAQSHDAQRQKASWILAVTVLFSFVAIQFGFTYYVSTQVFLFSALMLLYVVPTTVVAPSRYMLVAGGAAVFFAGQLFFLGRTDTFPSMLRCSREFLCFWALISIQHYSTDSRISYRIPRKIFDFIVILLLVATLAQWAFLARLLPYNVLMPEELFTMAGGTVMTSIADAAIAGGYEAIIRPTAFYSEPSYLGFVCLALYMSLHSQENLRRNVIRFFALLVVCVVARTAAGVVLISFLFGFLNRRLFSDKWQTGMVGAVLFVGVVYISIPFAQRIFLSHDAIEETSGYIRLVFPLKVFAKVLAEYPLGVPPLFINSFITVNLPGEEQITLDNGLMNIAIYFGYTGFVIFGVIVASIKSRKLVVFVFCCGLYNGSLFSYDKVVIIFCAMAAFINNERASGSRENVAVARGFLRVPSSVMRARQRREIS